ncbi:hypothetical protein [Marinobacter zhejiangensis]|uniref:Uncharacterized protein n=1 Tax=Marinobacter zhejiangensis TaxID=488535 RepID=A0A1I4PW37_9GAMM|nr:hypothetical protein [Marinobacter zhejiangensis]SFM32052.1 hypothetical protein SAMN04487963_2027 [Marinobacter zhejiangensis]
MIAKMILAFILLPQLAFAQDTWKLDVVNNTGYDIYYLYISHIHQQCWCEDRLGDDILEDGETVTLSLYSARTRSPLYEIRMEDEDGDTYTFYDFDVTQGPLVVTLDHLDQREEASEQ